MTAAVVGEVVVDGADDIELVGDLGLEGHEFADLDAGDIGFDGFEDAAIFGWGVGFHVIHLHVRRAAGEPDEDDGGVGFEEGFGGGRFCGLEPEDIAEGEAQHGEGTDLEEGTAGDWTWAEVGAVVTHGRRGLQESCLGGVGIVR